MAGGGRGGKGWGQRGWWLGDKGATDLLAGKEAGQRRVPAPILFSFLSSCLNKSLAFLSWRTAPLPPRHSPEHDGAPQAKLGRKLSPGQREHRRRKADCPLAWLKRCILFLASKLNLTQKPGLWCFCYECQFLRLNLAVHCLNKLH